MAGRLLRGSRLADTAEALVATKASVRATRESNLIAVNLNANMVGLRERESMRMLDVERESKKRKGKDEQGIDRYIG